MAFSAHAFSVLAKGGATDDLAAYVATIYPNFISEAASD